MNKDVFHAISMLDDDLIAEAGNAVRRVKKIKLSKIAAIAAAAIMLLGITAFATTIILSSRSGHSYNIPTYNSVPNAEILQRDIGFVPNIPAAFSNGYRFRSGHITQNEDYAEDGSIFEQFKGVSCIYKKGKQEITLHADTALAGIQIKNANKTDTYKGVELQYCAYTNKLVPPGYTMTEQDKADEKSGRLVFSYGNPEVALTHVQLLAWEYNGVNYELNAADSELSFEDFTAMAKEIIDTQQK